MPDPISITAELAQQLSEQFIREAVAMKMVGGTLSFSRKLTYPSTDKRRVAVEFTPAAYLKMLGLVFNFTGEVAWHGTVDRLATDRFRVTDIIVYPQEVSSAAVNTDQEAYQQWKNSLDDDTYNALRFHGHSHVNFAPNPSNTDLSHQEEIIQHFNRPDHYYIFMIINKKQEFNVWVYDWGCNTRFNPEDVDVLLPGSDDSMDKFLKEAKTLAKERHYTSKSSGYDYNSGGYPYAGGYGSGYGAQNYGGSLSAAKADKTAKSAGKPGKKSAKKTAKDDDDDFLSDDDWESGYPIGGIWDDVRSM